MNKLFGDVELFMMIVKEFILENIGENSELDP